MIDFREGVEPCQKVKEKVLAKKWTNITIEEPNEKFKCDCDACRSQKPYACQQPLMKRHQLIENPFFLKFQKWNSSKSASKVRNLSILFVSTYVLEKKCNGIRSFFRKQNYVSQC